MNTTKLHTYSKYSVSVDIVMSSLVFHLTTVTISRTSAVKNHTDDDDDVAESEQKVIGARSEES